MEAFFDIRTLSLFNGLISACLFFCTAYLNANRNVHRAFGQWTLAFMMNFLGFVLLSLRHILPVFITVIIANTLIVLCYLFIMRGLKNFAKVDQSSWVDVSLVFVFIIGFLMFSYIRPNLTARIVIISLAISLLCGGCCVITFRHVTLQLGGRNLLLVMAFALAVVLFLIRVTLTLSLEDKIGDFMSPSVIQGISIIVISIDNILIAIGLIMINGQWLENKVHKRTAELVEVNHALADSETRFRSLSDAAFEGIVISEKGAILEVNNAMAKMFGYKSAEVTGDGRKITDFVIPGCRKDIHNKIVSGYENAYETIGLKADGTQFPIEVQGKIYEYRGRRVRVSAVRDLTQQKKTEAALLESERMQGVIELAGAVCHEMSQPLMAAIGYSDLISEQIVKDDPLCEMISKMRVQISRAGKITKRLMKITKYETKDFTQGKIIDIEKASNDG
jgi:PAS domain S-box-containing protein